MIDWRTAFKDTASQMTEIGRCSDLDGTTEVAASTYTYDDAGLLTNLTHDSNGEVLSAYDWAYDKANRITQAASDVITIFPSKK